MAPADLRWRAAGRRRSRPSSDAADVLVSPRSRGTNTPLKIYQYLRSGRPIVATRLLTHTQVLSDDSAFLTPRPPEGFAAGILAALDDPDEPARVGAAARDAGRDEIQLRGLSCADATGVRRAARGGAAVSDGDGRRHADASRSLQLHGLRRSGDGARRSTRALRRPDRRLIAETQARVIAQFLAPLAGRTFSTSAPAQAAPRCSGRARRAASPASTLRRRCWPSRGARAEAHAARHVRRGRRARSWRFADRSFDARVSLRVLMHTPRWRAVASPNSAASRARASSSTSARAQRRRAPGGRAAGCRTRRAGTTEAYRVFADRAIRGARERRLSRHRHAPPVRPAHRVSQAHRLARASPRARRRTGAAGLLRLVGSPVTMLAER